MRLGCGLLAAALAILAQPPARAQAPAPQPPTAQPPAAQPPAPAPAAAATEPQPRRRPAQASAPRPPAAPALSLAQAEAQLIARNLQIVAAQRGVDAARAQVLVASSIPPPQVSYGQTFFQFGEGDGRIVGARGLSPASNLTLGITALVERGGKRELRTRLANEQVGIAEAQVLDALRTQVYQLRQAFITGLAARANLDVALANRASLDRTEALLARQVREGQIPEGDLIRFQASRLTFEQDVTTNAQAYAEAVANVAALLAADAATAPPMPAGRRPADAPAPRAFELRGRLETRADPGVPRDALAEAVANRPDVVAAQRQAAAAAANTRLAEAQRSRDVTVGLGWNRTRLSQDLPSASVPLRANDSAALQLSVPIFTARITEGNIGVAQAQQGQAEAQARQSLLQARADFATAWSAFQQARALIQIFDSTALRRAEESYQIAEQAYLAGGRSLLEVLDALRTLNQTRIQANNARAAYLTALATLEQATGVAGILPRL